MVNHPIQSTLVATGINLHQFTHMSGGFDYLQGGPFRGPGEVLIDQYYAAQKRGPGRADHRLFNHDWRVVGVIAGGKLARIVFPSKCCRS